MLKKIFSFLIMLILIMTNVLTFSTPSTVYAAGSISNDSVNKILTVQCNNLTMQFDYNNKLVIKSMKEGGTIDVLDTDELSYSGIKARYSTTAYEAENATINHSTTYSNSRNASGVRYVGGIDYADSYVQFNNVNASTAGTYNLEIKYANGYGQTGTHNLSINGGTAQTVTYPVTSGWGATEGWSSIILSVNLNAGNNTLRFSKGTNHVEIDSIKLANKWGGTNSLVSSPSVNVSGNVATFSNISYSSGECNVNETWTVTANDNDVGVNISRTYLQAAILDDQYSMLLSFKKAQFDTVMRTEDGGSLILMDPNRNVNRFLSHEAYSSKHIYGYYNYPNTLFNMRTTANVDLLDKGNQIMLGIELTSNRNRATRLYRNADTSSSRAFQIQHKLSSNEITYNGGLTKIPVDLCDVGVFDPVSVAANQTDTMTYKFSCQNNLDKYYDLGTIPSASGINEYNLAQYLQDLNRSGVMDLSFGNSDCCPGGMGEYEYYNYSTFALGLQSTGNEAFINTLKNVGTFFKDYGYNGNGTVKGRISGSNTGFEAGDFMDMPTQFVLGTVNTFDLCNDKTWMDSMLTCCRAIIDHYMASDSNDNGLIETGDNSGGTKDWNDQVYVASENGYGNALFYSALIRWADIENDVYGNSTRAAQYRNFADKLKSTYNKNIADGGLWDPNNNWFAYWRNTSINSAGGNVGHILTNALPIIFGMVDKARAQQIMDKFTDFKNSNGLTLFPTQQVAWNSSEINSQFAWKQFINGSVYIQMQREMMGAYARIGNTSMPLSLLNQCTTRYMQDNLWWIGPLNWDLTKDNSYDEAWMCANGRPATGFYEYIMGIQPKYNKLIVNPCVDSSLYGVNVNYTLRGHKFTIAANNDVQRQVNTDGSIPVEMWWSNLSANSGYTVIDENLTTSITTASNVNSDQNGKLIYSFSTSGTHRLTLSSCTFTDGFDDGNANGWTTYDGTWGVTNGQYTVNSNPGAKSIANGKIFLDFTYEADVSVGASGNAGLVFRLSNPGSGANTFTGYYAGIHAGSDLIEFGKSDGSTWTGLAYSTMMIDTDTLYHIKVVAKGNNIKVYVGDMTTPKVNVTDTSYASGAIGVRTYQADAKFDNIDVSTSYFTDGFDDGNANGWTTYDGTWGVTNGQYTVNSNPGAKSIANGKIFSDFTYEADVSVGASGNAGLVFRLSNPGSGANTFTGYYAGIHASSDLIEFGKSDGSTWTGLAYSTMMIDTDTLYHIKVVAKGNNIKVYVGDMTTPKVNVTDTSYASGAIGVRTYQADAKFDNINVSSSD